MFFAPNAHTSLQGAPVDRELSAGDGGGGVKGEVWEQRGPEGAQDGLRKKRCTAKPPTDSFAHSFSCSQSGPYSSSPGR